MRGYSRSESLTIGDLRYRRAWESAFCVDDARSNLESRSAGDCDSRRRCIGSALELDYGVGVVATAAPTQVKSRLSLAAPAAVHTG